MMTCEYYGGAAINMHHYGLKTIDLAAGHSIGSEKLCGRIITALKSLFLLNESVGAGYIERNWPMHYGNQVLGRFKASDKAS